MTNEKRNYALLRKKCL